MLLNILTNIFGEDFIWQDIVVAVVSLMFGLILIPQLVEVYRGKTTLNLFSASITTIGLYILAATFLTLDLWLSFLSDIIAGTVWLLLFIFSYRNLKKKKIK